MNSTLEVVEFVGKLGAVALREKRLGSKRGERRSEWKEEESGNIRCISAEWGIGFYNRRCRGARRRRRLIWRRGRRRRWHSYTKVIAAIVGILRAVDSESSARRVRTCSLCQRGSPTGIKKYLIYWKEISAY